MININSVFIKDVLRVSLAALFASAVFGVFAASACADGAETFSVTVPSSLPIEVDSRGNVLTASNLVIKNNKSGPIAVSSIKIRGENGWTLTSFGTEFSTKPTDICEYGLMVAGKEVPEDGNADLSGIPFIEGNREYCLAYDANLAVQTTDIHDEIIGEVLITVGWQEGQIYSLSITKAPDKTQYYTGESFDDTGMVVVATYYGGVQEVIEGYEIVCGDKLSEDQTGVTIRYTSEYGSTKSVVCPVKVIRQLSAIRLKSAPAKKSYKSGENFSSAGMIVEAVYADGSSRIVNDYSCSPSVINKGTDTVTVSYTENGITRYLSVGVEVEKSTKIQEGTMTLSGYEFDYDGSEKRPAVEFVLDGVKLSEGADYTLSYSNNINPGTACVTLTGLGKYSGTKSESFEIINQKRTIRISWSDTTLVCNNSCLAPSAAVEGLKDGDAAEVSVEGGQYVPGRYTAKASVTITQGNPAHYIIENDTCSFEIVKGQTPTLISGSIRLAMGVGGMPSTGAAVTEIVSSHTPEGNVAYTAVLDAEQTGALRGYAYPLSDGKYRLVISSNGSDTIRCNSNSSYAFASLASGYDGGCGYISGLEMMDFSGIKQATYMFQNLVLGDYQFPALNLSSATNIKYMFQYLSGNNISFTSISAPNAKSMEYLFQGAQIRGTLNMSGVNTSNIEKFGYMFSSASVGSLNLNCLNTSGCKNMDGMFKDANVNSLKLNNIKTSRVTSTSETFRNFSGCGTINISSWDMSAVVSSKYMFYNLAQVSSVYCPYNWASNHYFDYMFGAEGSSLSTVYSASDFVTTAAYSQTQEACGGNINLNNAAVSSLKLKSNGGILTYSQPLSD